METRDPHSHASQAAVTYPQSVSITTLTEFVRYVETNCRYPDTILFRGQRSDWPLRPKIARLIHRISSESRGHSRESIPDVERQMLGDFQRRSVPYLSVRPDSNWEWLALAQHHGMATRLLDWSSNPLAALWFAIANPPEKDKQGQVSPAVVWVLKPDVDDRIDPTPETKLFDCTQTKVIRLRHITNRIVAQSGWFTVHACSEATPYFESLESDANYKAKLVKLLINPTNNNFGKLRYMLDRCAVNHVTIYPDLGGLSSHIEWNNMRLEDEPEDMWKDSSVSGGGDEPRP